MAKSVYQAWPSSQVSSHLIWHITLVSQASLSTQLASPTVCTTATWHGPTVDMRDMSSGQLSQLVLQARLFCIELEIGASLRDYSPASPGPLHINIHLRCCVELLSLVVAKSVQLEAS